MAKGWDIVKDVAKYVNKGKTFSTVKSDVIRGVASGAVRAVGDVASAFIDQNTRKEVLKGQLDKDKRVAEAQLELLRHNNIIKAFTDAKSPAGFVAAVVGAATSPKKYRELTATPVDTSKI